MITDIVNQAFNSGLGNTERAVIEIKDYRNCKTQKEKVPKEVQPAGVQPCGSILKTKSKLPNTDMLKIENTALNKIADMVEKEAVKEQQQRTGRYKVQFNPDTLVLSAESDSAEDRASSTDGDGANSVQYGAVDANIKLEVTLLFDQVNVQDSFMFEKFRLDPVNLLSGAVKGITKGIRGEEYTVQREVEGFLAALRNKETREINFCWGDLHYEGTLNSVSSKYTMFNVSGKPVRAEVNLTILCRNAGVNATSLGVWAEYYKAVFPANDNLNQERAVQNAGNLLNLNF